MLKLAPKFSVWHKLHNQTRNLLYAKVSLSRAHQRVATAGIEYTIDYLYPPKVCKLLPPQCRQGRYEADLTQYQSLKTDALHYLYPILIWR